MSKRQVTLVTYENTKSGITYYGYRVKDAMKKDIDGEVYMEVTSSVSKPKLHWVKLEHLEDVGLITFDLP